MLATSLPSGHVDRRLARGAQRQRLYWLRAPRGRRAGPRPRPSLPPCRSRRRWRPPCGLRGWPRGWSRRRRRRRCGSRSARSVPGRRGSPGPSPGLSRRRCIQACGTGRDPVGSAHAAGALDGGDRAEHAAAGGYGCPAVDGQVADGCRGDVVLDARGRAGNRACGPQRDGGAGRNHDPCGSRRRLRRRCRLGAWRLVGCVVAAGACGVGACASGRWYVGWRCAIRSMRRSAACLAARSASSAAHSRSLTRPLAFSWRGSGSSAARRPSCAARGRPPGHRRSAGWCRRSAGWCRRSAG